MCAILSVKINGFKLGLRESHVKHEDTSAINIFLIAIAPFLFGISIAIIAIILSMKTFVHEIIPIIILNWLAISIIFYSIPSSQDTKNVKNSAVAYLGTLWKKGILGFLIIILYVPVILVPAYILLYLFDIFTKYEALRIVLILLTYILISYLL